MVALAPGISKASKRKIEDARSSLKGDPPPGLEWVNRLTPVHQRQFAVELYSTLARLNVTEDASEVIELLEAWEATAEIDIAPEVAEKLSRSDKQYREWAGG
jgi:hypothetical protein